MKHAGTLSMAMAARAAPSGLPNGHLAKINALQARRGKAALAEDDVLARFVRLTGNQITSIFTRFRKADLEAMIAQVNQAGAPLLSAHITDDRPIGTFYAAQLTEEDGVLWMDTYAYWLNDEDGQKLARDIDGGILNEASIGWYYEDAICSVCNQDYLGYDCSHWRGETYTITDPETGVSTEKLCFIWTVGCEIAEGSVVYAGAHPDTRVGGQLSPPEPVVAMAAPHPTRFQAAASRDMLAVLQKAPAKGEGKPLPAAEQGQKGEGSVKLTLKLSDGSVREVDTSQTAQALLESETTAATGRGEQAHREAVAQALGLAPKDVTPERLGELKTQAAAGVAYRESLSKRLEQAALAVKGVGPAYDRIVKLGKNAELGDLEGLVEDYEAERDESIPKGRLSRDEAQTEKLSEPDSFDHV